MATMPMSTRKILVSPGFGAGWSTWNDDSHAQALAEDPELVAMVAADRHRGKCTVSDLRAAGVESTLDTGHTHEASLAFVLRATTVNGGDVPYFGGVNGLKIEVIDGRYRIDEYDGSESLHTESGEVWR